ncbi:hypothetical protein H7J77_14050 [Mycolicibacillus parakoreensis]|uniref:Transposase n=1 Tax=Mycolicibacillus parakoreensis TaxID=1069221 RepID=A0ABY3TYS0_9MYCO|nr:hypothetical protein [Mycolicibacillus parakoreensis]MCV7316657.1 hypothetical protein [Mycolicibacillus parakoreensis]ULN52867.1 hypothetical protein MIU77_00230 [Mycolicibacillus parakoreensis]
MTNSEFELPYRLTDQYFRQARIIIDRSRVEETLDGYHAESHAGGRPTQGIRYTLTAVLTAALSLIMLGRAPTLKSILVTIGGFTGTQLTEVGMTGQDTRPLFGAVTEQLREYKRFTAWLNRMLTPIDPAPDQPAERITNAQHRRIIANRTPQQQEACARAGERLKTVINDLVAASILDPHPAACRGDLVADETIIDLASPAAGLGTKDDKNRGAASFGKYYARDGRFGPVSSDGRATGKAGFGVGITALTRVGPPDQLHQIPQVMLAIDIHEPTSGSPEALDVCLTHVKRSGLDSRVPNARYWPTLTVDMGYNPKDSFAHVMLRHQYSAVVRYPQPWSLLETSANPPGTPDTEPLPGPIQFAGSFYCPAAEPLLRDHRVPKSRELLATNDWSAHDERLAATLPLLMGTNSGPTERRKRGRPRLGEPSPTRIVQELVCPAVQRRVRCPLKPASMTQTPFGTPLVTPTWTAEERACCTNSFTTVTFTDRQLKKAQFGRYPGASWEHMIYFEAARAATEQRFSLLKSPHIARMVEMRWGPRREPMVKILLALAVAATNHQIQKSHNPTKRRAESTDIRWRQLAHHLGRDPVRTPPRT